MKMSRDRLLRKELAVLLNLGFWVVYLVLTMVILGVLYGNEESVDDTRLEKAFQVILFFALIPSAISFYMFYFLLFPKYLLKKKVLASIIYGVLISLGSAILGFAILWQLPFDCGAEEENVGAMIGAVIFMSFIALVCGVIALVIKGFITWFEEIKLKEALKQKNHEMELALVKSQLDPHFLFNTINNIDVLIIKNAQEASAYLNKLSDIMRFMLFETKTDEVKLSKEIQYIEKYIELQKIRTANSNYINFSITGNPEDRTISPMVFIPFIENAFKHTTNKKIDDAINIHIHIENGTIKLECINKLDTTRKLQQESNGLGNELIKKRLQLIYPERHTLEVVNQNDMYRVYLTISNGSV